MKALIAGRHTVSFSAGAETDLDNIHRYISEKESIAEADALLDRLLERAATLDTFPNKGSIPKELEDLGISRYRQVVLLPYRLIYRIVGSNVIVTIIADGRRDMPALLARRLLSR